MNTEVKLKDLKREYDGNFVPSKEYLDSMPDLQNSEFEGIPIEFVGIQNYQIPIVVKQRDGGTQQVLASLYGEVDCDSDAKGINMSRLGRSFFKSKDDVFDINHLEKVLRDYKNDLKSLDAHILIEFPYYLWLPALKSVKDNGEKEGGYQVYKVIFDANMDKTGEFKKVMHVFFKYQSCCPCSSALSEYAAYTRGVYGSPHNQRSVAKVSVEFDEMIWIEEIIEICRRALVNETMVFCKRIDEMEHAILAGANPQFVEDSIRRLAVELNKDERIKDWRAICSHRESIHNFDCHAVKVKGIPNSIFNHHISIAEYKELEV